MCLCGCVFVKRGSMNRSVDVDGNISSKNNKFAV